MGQRRYNFQFGRILLTGRPFEESKKEFLQNAIQTTAICADRFHKYIFLDSEMLQVNSEDYFVGKLVKYKAIEEEIVNEQIHQLGSSLVEDAVVAKSEFIIHARTGIVSFRPISNKISSDQFRDKLARLLELAYDSFFISVKVEAINNDLKIQEAFDKFKSIQFININLHPSNPGSRDIWEQIDNRIQNLGAVRLEEIIEGGLGGLNPDLLKKDEIYKGILMAADGYGHAKVKGIVDSREVTVTTSDNPTITPVVLDGVSENLIRQLIPTFRLIIGRIPHIDE